jgi:hypothetical protein
MEIRPNTFSLRGESGLVKIVSDSVFDSVNDGALYTDNAQCDIVVESNGFRVNRTIVLNMPQMVAFLRELGDIVERGAGEAVLRPEGDELSLVVTGSRNECLVHCAMNDRREGKENSVQVKYAIEPSYYADLKRELAEAKIPALRR